MKAARHQTGPHFGEKDVLAYVGLAVGVAALAIVLVQLYRPDIAASAWSGAAQPADQASSVHEGIQLNVPDVDSFARPIKAQTELLLVPVVCGPCLDAEAIRKSLPDVGVPIVIVTRARLADVPHTLVADSRLRVVAGRESSVMLPAELGTPSVALWLQKDGTISGMARAGETLAQFARRMQR